MDAAVLIIFLIWCFVVPFIGIRLVFFGGFQSKEEKEDDDFYWLKKDQKDFTFDYSIGVAFLIFYVIFMYYAIEDILRMACIIVFNQSISSLWS